MRVRPVRLESLTYMELTTQAVGGQYVGPTRQAGKPDLQGAIMLSGFLDMYGGRTWSLVLDMVLCVASLLRGATSVLSFSSRHGSCWAAAVA